MTNETYKVQPVICPHCGERIEVDKKRDRSSIHGKRIGALAKHLRESHANG